MSTKGKSRGNDTPFATAVLRADDFRDPEFPVVDAHRLGAALHKAGFYVIHVDRSSIVLAPPFVHAVSSDGKTWTFQQWRPGRRK